MKPQIMERASDALAVSNRDPFPRREWRPAMTKTQCAVFQQQMNHARPVFHGRSVALVAHDTPPTAEAPKPESQKVRPHFHFVRFARVIVIRVIRKFCR
jgi:hypothetical protein